MNLRKIINVVVIAFFISQAYGQSTTFTWHHIGISFETESFKIAKNTDREFSLLCTIDDAEESAYISITEWDGDLKADELKQLAQKVLLDYNVKDDSITRNDIELPEFLGHYVTAPAKDEHGFDHVFIGAVHDKTGSEHLQINAWYDEGNLERILSVLKTLRKID
jgi:hypothetical protein